MARRKPGTVGELFNFYYEDFKPLYSHLQTLNEPPLEMFFEVNAALDHLSRHWQYDQDETEAVHAAAAHLKRGCFDAFKIVVRETVDHYEELRRVDTSIIDNGEFDRRMLAAIHDIRAGAVEARQAEGDSRDREQWHLAYELWEPVYIKCREFDENFYRNPKVEWARKKHSRRAWWHRLEGFLIAVVAGLVVWLIVWLLTVWVLPGGGA